MLYDSIWQAQTGSDKEMMELVLKFTGLFKKYGRKLGYEDAENDLVADFIELIRHFKLNKLHNTSDGAIVNFIYQSTYRAYLKRMKNEIEKKLSVVSFEDLTPVQLQQAYSGMATVSEEAITSYFPEVGLTDKEIMILDAIYGKGYTVSDVAAFLGVSRQNVNQIKMRAITKLKRLYVQKECL